MLVWQYADDAAAVVTSYDAKLSRDEMRRVAAAFTGTTPRPVRQPYTSTWIPPHLRLVAVETPDEGRGWAVFVPEPASGAFTVTARGDRTRQLLASAFPGDPAVPALTPVPSGAIVLGVSRSSDSSVGPTPLCRPAGDRGAPFLDGSATCTVALADKVTLTVRGYGSVPLDDLRRVAEAGRAVGAFGEGARGGVAATEAFPTSVQVPRR